ncbi:GumC family protein [Methylobacterium sp. ID0610]|uniref:GumC family protein n=1 Tax=Methylobacterium carpenticola TaxID=3344827 RepID=UPI0036C17EFB
MLKRQSIDLAYETYDSLVNSARVSAPGDVSFLLGVVRRRRRLIGLCTLVGLGMGLLAFALLPRGYLAEAQIVIDFRRLAVIAPNEAAFNYRMSDAAVQTQVAIVVSDSVLRRVVDKLDLTKDPDFVRQPGFATSVLSTIGLVADPSSLAPDLLRDQAVIPLRKVVRSEREGISYMITIKATSSDAEKAARIANAVAAAYVEDQQGSRSTIAEQAHEWYKARLSELQDLAATALRAAADFRARNQIVVASGRYVEEQQIEDYSIRLLGTQNRRVIAQARLERVDAMLKQGTEGQAVLGGSVAEELRNPIIVGLLSRANDIRRRNAENINRYGPNHEAVKRGELELAEIQRAVDDELRRVLEALRSEAEITKSEEINLQAILKDLGNRVTAAQKARVELDLLEAAATSYTKLRDLFVQQYSAATQQETYPVNETLIQTRATPPLRPNSPALRQTLVGGSAAGLVLGLCVAFGLQAFDRRLRTRAQLELVTGRPCLGYVPATDPPGHGALSQRFHESILLNIRGGADERSPRVVGIAGAMPEHGASQISLKLADLAARTCERVLFVDLHQTVHAPTAGSGSVTAPMASLGVMPHAARPNLFLLPSSALRAEHAGRADGLDLSRLSVVLEEARHNFDLVIVDLPPLAPVTSTRQVTALLDCFVLVVAWYALGAQELSDLLSSYGDLGDRMIGAVYSRVDLGKVDETEDAALINTVSLLDDRREAA